jgi:DNA-directed RNA polymerase subunit K/omega
VSGAATSLEAPRSADAPAKPAAAVAGPAPQNGVSAGLSRFHIIVLAFQRAKQLRDGARPRVEVATRRPTRVALAEVMADTISWTVK